MARVSRDVIEHRLARMVQEIDAIERDRPDSLEEYVALADSSAGMALQHRIFVATQAMVDIAAHIVASQGYGAPDTYRDAISELVRHRVITPEIADEVQGAVGLRNAIAHLYLTLDPAQLYAGLCKTSELKRFAAAVWEWMEGQ